MSRSVQLGFGAGLAGGARLFAAAWLAVQFVDPFSCYGSAASQFVRPPAWSKEGMPDSGFGGWIAAAGDVNGDGFADVLICAPNADRDRGQVFLFLGSARGLSTQPAWTASGESPGALFGSIAMGVGDINKDGFADVMIGAPYQRSGNRERAGCAYLFLGSTNGLSRSADWTYRGQDEFVEVGGSVGSAGDVNGDGFADVVISAAHFRKAAIQLGRVMVFYGSPQGLRSEPDWIQDGDQPSGNFGETVAGACCRALLLGPFRGFLPLESKY